MFDQLVESARVKKDERRWRCFAITAVVWLLSLAAVIITGIFAYDARLGAQYETAILISPPLPSNAPTAGPMTRAIKPEQQKRFESVETMPEQIRPTRAAPPEIPLNLTGSSSGSWDEGGIITNHGGSVPGGPSGNVAANAMIRSAATGPAPLPPEPKSKETLSQKPLRQPSSVLQGSAIKKITPAYPHIARIAGISGAVIVEVVIDEAGNCVSARALSGHPLLKDAAVTAARNWKWNPTRLNGVPVQVVGTITFNFSL